MVTRGLVWPWMFLLRKQKLLNFVYLRRSAKTVICVTRIDWAMAIFHFAYFGFMLFEVSRWNILKRGCEDTWYFLERNSSPSVSPALTPTDPVVSSYMKTKVGIGGFRLFRSGFYKILSKHTKKLPKRFIPIVRQVVVMSFFPNNILGLHNLSSKYFTYKQK